MAPREQPESDKAQRRRDQILSSACRVIARLGLHVFRIRDVADDAGVSQALVSYYFPARTDLIVEAFVYADRRNASFVGESKDSGSSGRERLTNRLVTNLGAEPEIQEAWWLWQQIWAAAPFEEALEAPVRERQEVWISTLAELLEEGKRDGSISEGVDSKLTGAALATLVDGLWAAVLNSAMDRNTARAVLRHTIDHQLDT